MPICRFDIGTDGSAAVAPDDALEGPGAYRWHHFDLSDPTLRPWAAQHLAEIPAASLLQPKTRPRCDPFGDALILNLRGINLNAGEDADEMVSIRMFVTRKAIVTVRRNNVFALQDIRHAAEAGAAPPGIAAFLEQLIIGLTDRVQDHVEQIDVLADAFEDALEDPDTRMPRALPENRRAVIRLRRYLDPQRVALDRLAALQPPLIPAENALALRELANRAIIAVEELDELRDRLVSVQDEHDANVAQRQARHGYVLSLAAALFLPLGFLTGLFGVNVGGLPGLEDPQAFAKLCLAMGALCLVLLGFLKWRRWL